MTQIVEQPNQTFNDDESVVEFVPLLHFEQDYEILNQHPFTIRKKSSHRVLKETIQKDGYFTVQLNGKTFRKHRLIGLQFLPNPDPIKFDVIDHLNRDRTDNKLQNLRWTSQSSNSYNKSSHRGVEYEFIDDLPDNSTIIDFYDLKNGERKEFEEGKYYYHFDESTNEDKFFGRITDKLYKILHINTTKSGNEFVSLRDVNNQKVSFYINKFKFQHDLL